MAEPSTAGSITDAKRSRRGVSLDDDGLECVGVGGATGGNW